MTNGFTPLTPISGFTEDQLFQDDVGSLLQQLEGPEPLPYADTHGVATVGIGFNLTVLPNLAAYFSMLDISPTGQAVLTTLFKELWPGTSGTSDLRNAIVANGISLSSVTLSDANIETLWNDLVIGDANGNNLSGQPAYLPAFEQYLADHHVSPDILSSQDGLAIFSLFYNNQSTLIPPGRHPVASSACKTLAMS